MLGHTIWLVYSCKIQLMNNYLNLTMRIAGVKTFYWTCDSIPVGCRELGPILHRKVGPKF